LSTFISIKSGLKHAFSKNNASGSAF
jgi:hypothetical protein